MYGTGVEKYQVMEGSAYKQNSAICCNKVQKRDTGRAQGKCYVNLPKEVRKLFSCFLKGTVHYFDDKN